MAARASIGVVLSNSGAIPPFIAGVSGLKQEAESGKVSLFECCVMKAPLKDVHSCPAKERRADGFCLTDLSLVGVAGVTGPCSSNIYVCASRHFTQVIASYALLGNVVVTLVQGIKNSIDFGPFKSKGHILGRVPSYVPVEHGRIQTISDFAGPFNLWSEGGNPSPISFNGAFPAILKLANQEESSASRYKYSAPSAVSSSPCPTYKRGFIFLLQFLLSLALSAVICDCADKKWPKLPWLFPIAGVVCLIIFGGQMARLSSEIRNCGSENIRVQPVVVPELEFRDVQRQIFT